MENFKPAEKIADPTPESEKAVKKWDEEQKRKQLSQEKKNQRRERQIAEKTIEEKKKIKEEEMANRKTNAEVAEMPEFKEWCQDRGVEATKRSAAKNREEFEAWLEQKAHETDNEQAETIDEATADAA